MKSINSVPMIDEKAYANAGRAMIVNVRGRVEGCKTYAGKRYTRVLIPAVDAYSNPQLVEIRSRGRLGVRDAEISCTCVLGGFRRNSPEVKEKRKGNSRIEHTLDLCESAG